MKLPSLTLAMLFVALCLFGCSGPTAKPTAESASPTLNTKAAVLERIEGASKLTESMLQAFEGKYQCKLPADYRRFLLQDNGGFPSPDCVTFKEDGRTTVSNVFCFHCLGDELPWVSLEWHCETFGGRLPKDTLPIGHDSCGNLWLLNFGSKHVGSVAFWDHGSFETFDETDFDAWPRVASSFQEFLGSLREYNSLTEDAKLLSRYAMVQKAVEGMASKSPGFNKHSALDYAWHCNYEDGNVTMECVQYEAHAVATHTDGYSDLRAAKGLIKSGPTRLPK